MSRRNSKIQSNFYSYGLIGDGIFKAVQNLIFFIARIDAVHVRSLFHCAEFRLCDVVPERFSRLVELQLIPVDPDGCGLSGCRTFYEDFASGSGEGGTCFGTRNGKNAGS